MALPNSKLLVWIEPPTAFVRVLGRAAVEGAVEFKALVHRLRKEGIEQFCLDLTECKLMDSTFSGVLAALASETEGNSDVGKRRFTLVNPNVRVTDLLDNLGVLPLVDVLTGELAKPISGTEEAIAPNGASKTDIADCCLKAHQFLIALKPENHAKFSELTRILEQQTSAGRSSS